LAQASTIDFKAIANLHKTRIEGKMKLDTHSKKIEPYHFPTIRIGDPVLKQNEQIGMKHIAEGKRR